MKKNCVVSRDVSNNGRHIFKIVILIIIIIFLHFHPFSTHRDTRPYYKRKKNEEETLKFKVSSVPPLVPLVYTPRGQKSQTDVF